MKHLTILLSLLAILSLQADDILVNGSGLDGTYSTISAAVEAASPGDRLLIAPQDFPYQEDTLFIDKDLTLMPAATNTFVFFEGHILLTLDAITNFTLVGFRSNNSAFSSISSVVNNNNSNTYSIVNIVDCKIQKIHLGQPQTSLYLSYSDVTEVSFAHGDIIGNDISRLYFGTFDYTAEFAQNIMSYFGYTSGESSNYSEEQSFWPRENSIWMDPTYINTEDGVLNEDYHMTECDLFENYIPFGEANTYSNTCNIVANNFTGYMHALTLFSLDFPFDIRNNYFDGNTSMSFYLVAPNSKGTNKIINNYNGYPRFYLAYCPDSEQFNFSDVTINTFNNYNDCIIRIYSPPTTQNTDSYASFINSKSTSSYNTQQWVNAYSDGVEGVVEALYNIGPQGSTAENGGHPSLEYLDLDLTPNTPGPHGGSHAWINYHGTTDYQDAGNMPSGGKARITYLNLPTQIYDPSINISIKAKSVHGN